MSYLMSGSAMIALTKVTFYCLIIIIISGVSIPISSKIIEMAGVSDTLWSVFQFIPKLVFATIMFLGFFFLRKYSVESSGLIRLSSRGALAGVALASLYISLVLIIYFSKDGKISGGGLFQSTPSFIFWARFFAWIFVVACAIPIVEELVFRRILYPVAINAIGVYGGAIFVSSLFALLHPNNYWGSFMFSVGLCVIAHRYGVVSSIVAHAASNAAIICVENFLGCSQC